MTREDWIALAGGTKEAMEAEEWILGAGEEFLPQHVKDAIADDTKQGPEYWSFLAAQLEESRHP